MVQSVTKEPAVCCLVPLQPPRLPPPSLPAVYGFQEMTRVISPFTVDNMRPTGPIRAVEEQKGHPTNPLLKSKGGKSCSILPG